MSESSPLPETVMSRENLVDDLAIIAKFGRSGITAPALARIQAHDAALRAKLEEAERERDLAIAHDRQPYPTAEAYELVCVARNALAEQLREARTIAITLRNREFARAQRLWLADTRIEADGEEPEKRRLPWETVVSPPDDCKE